MQYKVKKDDKRKQSRKQRQAFKKFKKSNNKKYII